MAGLASKLLDSFLYSRTLTPQPSNTDILIAKKAASGISLCLKMTQVVEKVMVRGSCGGWDRGLARGTETEKAQGQKTAPKTRHVPTISCTMCLTALKHPNSSYRSCQLIVLPTF